MCEVTPLLPGAAAECIVKRDAALPFLSKLCAMGTTPFLVGEPGVHAHSGLECGAARWGGVGWGEKHRTAPCTLLPHARGT